MIYHSNFYDLSEEEIRDYAKYIFTRSGLGTVNEETVQDWIEEKDFIVDEIHMFSKYRDYSVFKQYLYDEYDRRTEKLRVGVCSICGCYTKGRSKRTGIYERHFGNTDFKWKHKICNECGVMKWREINDKK